MPTFEHLVRKLFKVTKRVDRSLEEMQQKAAHIQQKYEPRQEFERWKQTLGGRKWKREQFEQQNGRCLKCQKSISLKGSHIDHIKPLSLYPKLAIAPENLRILCPDCNLTKGQQETSTPRDIYS